MIRDLFLKCHKSCLVGQKILPAVTPYCSISGFIKNIDLLRLCSEVLIIIRVFQFLVSVFLIFVILP